MPRLDVRAMRREQILDAMEPLVARRGWEHTTFAEICRAAGISNRVLTYHFKDKDDLLFAVFERTVHRVRENLEPLAPEGLPFAEKLAFMLGNAAVQHEKQQLSLLFLHLMAQAAVHPEIAARLHAVIGEIDARLAEELARDAAAGHIRDDGDPESAAALIHSVMLGVMLGRCVLGMAIPSERVLAMLLAFLHADPLRESACGSPTPRLSSREHEEDSPNDRKRMLVPLSQQGIGGGGL
jgi:AcrR family transcriptional regulator